MTLLIDMLPKNQSHPVANGVISHIRLMGNKWRIKQGESSTQFNIAEVGRTRRLHGQRINGNFSKTNLYQYKQCIMYIWLMISYKWSLNPLSCVVHLSFLEKDQQRQVKVIKSQIKTFSLCWICSYKFGIGSKI